MSRRRAQVRDRSNTDISGSVARKAKRRLDEVDVRVRKLDRLQQALMRISQSCALGQRISAFCSCNKYTLNSSCRADYAQSVEELFRAWRPMGREFRNTGGPGFEYLDNLESIHFRDRDELSLIHI